jgi:hypothetical protein
LSLVLAGQRCTGQFREHPSQHFASVEEGAHESTLPLPTQKQRRST